MIRCIKPTNFTPSWYIFCSNAKEARKFFHKLKEEYKIKYKCNLVVRNVFTFSDETVTKISKLSQKHLKGSWSRDTVNFVLYFSSSADEAIFLMYSNEIVPNDK